MNTQPEDEGARHQGITRAFSKQIAACDQLRTFAFDVLTPWRGRDWERLADVVVAGEGARGLKTFRASLVLAAAGFGPQAAMLNRSLFEGMLVAHWVRENQDSAESRIRDHHAHGELQWVDALRRHGWEAALEIFSTKVSEEERPRLEELFGKHGTRHWTGLNTHQLVAAVCPQWDDGGAELRLFLDIAQHDNNQILHSSAWSIGATAIFTQGDDATTRRFMTGPSTDYVDRGLYGAFWSYVQVLSLLMDHFEMPRRDELTELHERLMRTVFHELTDEQMRTTGRNDPCPCGSGSKFKRCHGA